MERKWMRTTATTLALLTLMAGTSMAAGLPVAATADKPVVVSAPGLGVMVTTAGELQQAGESFTVDGWTLVGDSALFAKLKGQEVWVLGARTGSADTQQVLVTRIERNLAANRVLPAKVTLNDQPVAFDQAPYMHKGTLMLPLRALAEAAGGKIEWNQETWTAHVIMSDRTADFTMGQNKAKMYLNNARYFTRNFLTMDQNVVIVGGRMFISADAVSNVLGMREEVTANETVLALRFPGAGQPDVTTPATPDITFDLQWDGNRLQISGKANVPDLQFVVKRDGQVVAQADTTVKEGFYIGNVIVEGGAAQAGKLELFILDPASGRELASMPLNDK